MKQFGEVFGKLATDKNAKSVVVVILHRDAIWMNRLLLLLLSFVNIYTRVL